MKKSICIDMLFSSLDFYDRFGAAADCGFDTVEFWKWSNKDIDRVRERLDTFGQGVSVFNVDSADGKLSADLSRGILNAGRREEFLSALRESEPVYRKLGARAMIVLVGEEIPTLSRQAQIDNVRTCLETAAPFAEREGITLVVEPLNRTERPNYLLPEAVPVMDILKAIDSPRVKMLYDIYHQNVTGDFDLSFVLENIDRIGHFHIADCPGRHEPGTGKVDYPAIIRAVGETTYDGYFGMEYRATKPEKETFGFLGENV